MRVAALTPMGPLQRLLPAIVLPGVLLALGSLTLSLVAAVSGLSRLMTLALPMPLLARLGAVRVLTMPVRPTMASTTVRAIVRPAHVAALGLLTRLSTLRYRLRAVPIRGPMATLMRGIRPAHVATMRTLAVRVTGTVLAMASGRPLRLTATLFG